MSYRRKYFLLRRRPVRRHRSQLHRFPLRRHLVRLILLFKWVLIAVKLDIKWALVTPKLTDFGKLVFHIVFIDRSQDLAHYGLHLRFRVGN